jgi:hypothetical protein
MNILYVGPERQDAQVVATALRSLAQNVSITWTARLESAAAWVNQHEDLAALIVDAKVDGAGWRPLLDQLRGLAARPGVIVITPENGGSPREFADADEFLARSASLRRDLSAVVRRTLERERAGEHTAAAEQVPTEAERDRAPRAGLERRIAEAEAALRESEARHQAAIAAAVERAAQQQAQYEIGLARAGAAREMLDEQLREAGELVARSRRDREAAAADVDRLSRRETELSAVLAEADAARLALQERLAAAETAAAAAAVRGADDLRGAAERFAERQRELERRIAHAIEQRTGVEKHLAQAESEREAAGARHAEALADAGGRRRELELALGDARREVESRAREVERLAGREAELTSMLAAGAASHAQLERRLTAAAEAFREAADREARERAAAARQAGEREAELGAQVESERAARERLELASADASATLHDTQRRYETALAVAAEERADREAQLTRELAEAAAARDSFARQVRDAEFDLEQLQRDARTAAAEIVRLTAGEAQLTSELAEARAVNGRLEVQLATAAAAIAGLEARHVEVIESRDALQRTLDETRSAALDVERTLNKQIDGLRSDALEQASRSDALLADTRRTHDIRVAELEEVNRCRTAERDGLQQSLDAAEQQLRDLHAEHDDACARFEQARTEAAAEIARVTAAREELARTLEAARAEAQDTADRLFNEYTAVLIARDQELEQRQGQLVSAEQALQNLQKNHQEARREADRVPQLLKQLDESRADGERAFQQAQVAMIRCSRDGSLLQANRAWSVLVRRQDEPRGKEFVAAVFETPKDLSWLIEQCRGTSTKESMETTLRRDDGVRLFVRLSACVLPRTEVIEVVAEDLTRPRMLEDRLAQAGRMEAVGRVASEAALTCAQLLAEARQTVQQSLIDRNGATQSRSQGETVLDQLTRASRYLEQLVAYSDKHHRARSAVDLHTLIGDLAPALKHVAGDHVDVQLPGPSSSLTVDVETERVERLLVNLAAYGRGRLPSGGRLTIEIGTSSVGGHFAARYPNVRPGPHALITVTGERRAGGTDTLPNGVGAPAVEPEARAPQPAVDLGALHALVGECGGHLWMRIQPLGDIVAKVRLPLLSAYGAKPHSRSSAPRSKSARTITRWFQR